MLLISFLSFIDFFFHIIRRRKLLFKNSFATHNFFFSFQTNYLINLKKKAKCKGHKPILN
jgi:hypothetical protein